MLTPLDLSPGVAVTNLDTGRSIDIEQIKLYHYNPGLQLFQFFK
jgi:hypothetical protein